MTVKAIALIDGFNLYGALNANVRGKKPFENYKWVNYWQLMEQFLAPSESLVSVDLFTALPIKGMHDAKAKRSRHVLLLDAQRDSGVQIVEGRFAPRQRRCLVKKIHGGCGKMFWRHEEKRTDVNLAVRLVSLAYEEAYDTAFVVTADSDLAPAIEQARKGYPSGRIVNVAPIGRLNEAKYLAPPVSTAQALMTEKHLQSAQFPRTHTLTNGRVIICPKEWQ